MTVVPVPVVLAAAVLTVKGVSCLLVGSAALRLHGTLMPVRDVDVVIEPGEQNIHRLHAALAGMVLRRGAVPSAWRMSQLHTVSVATAYGKLDCLLERGRLDWDRLVRSAVFIPVADVPILVAGCEDALDLRRKFKE